MPPKIKHEHYACICTMEAQNASLNYTLTLVQWDNYTSQFEHGLPFCCEATFFDSPVFHTMAVLIPVLLGIACMIHCRNRWDEKQEQKKRAAQMMNDMDGATADVGLEMNELNPAARAAAMEAEQAARAAGGEESGGGGSGGMAGVKHELGKLRLDRYASAFEEHGFDFWPKIMRLPPKRFAKMVETVGMAENHADRLKETLRVQRSVQGISLAKEL